MSLHPYADGRHQVHFVVVGTQAPNGTYTFASDAETTMARFDEGLIYVEGERFGGDWVSIEGADVWVDDMDIELSKRLAEAPPEPMSLPLPGEPFLSLGTVIASGYQPQDDGDGNELPEHFGLLLLTDTPGAYYRVMEYDPIERAVIYAHDYSNIVPATVAFHERYAFFGGDPAIEDPSLWDVHGKF